MSRPGFTVGASLEKGKLTLNNEGRYRDLLRRLKDGDYDVTIERQSIGNVAKKRGYYHAVVVEAFVEHWGVDHNDAHDLLKQHCNKKIVERVNKETGEAVEEVVAASTAGFTAEEWTLYIERCHRWAAMEWGFVVPDPDPEHALHKYEREQAAHP